MTWSRKISVTIGVASIFLAVMIVAFVGNQRLAYASIAPVSGAEIVCHVFTILNELGEPIPVLDGGNCPGSTPPPAPPPPPPPPSPPPPSPSPSPAPSPTPNPTPSPSPNPTPNPTPMPACSNGTDDDGDELADAADSGCHTDFNAANAASYSPSMDSEAAAPACSDGIDNDTDGKIDLLDPGCTGATDTDETDPPKPACSDGLDNDGDGKVDAANDPGCDGAGDTDEGDPPVISSGGGGSPSTGSGSSSGGGSPPSTGSGSSSGGGNPIPASTLFTSTSTHSTSTGQVGGVGASVVPGIVLGFSTTTESCDRYLTAFIKEGQQNDTDQVRRLQRFLRDYEKALVSETGIYDAATIAAVHAFQTKYASKVLAPWGISESTGYTYLTTRKMVNEIVCKNTKTFPLTLDEARKIDEARAAKGLSVIVQKTTTPRVPSTPKQPTPKKPATSTGSGQAKPQAPTSQTANDAFKNTFEFFKNIFNRSGR